MRNLDCAFSPFIWSDAFILKKFMSDTCAVIICPLSSVLKVLKIVILEEDYLLGIDFPVIDGFYNLSSRFQTYGLASFPMDFPGCDLMGVFICPIIFLCMRVRSAFIRSPLMSTRSSNFANSSCAALFSINWTRSV
jgi:hypothetical protein